MKKYSFLIISMCVLFACAKKQSSSETTDSSNHDSALPVLTFSEKEFNFGDIKEGEIVKHSFKFKNTGSTYLKIQDVKASCGCTVPEWPKEAIAPQAEGEIRVEFNSTGKMGVQTKGVTVTANTDPQITQLTIKASILTKK